MKTFWVNILRSLSQVREAICTSKELTWIETTCMETTGNRQLVAFAARSRTQVWLLASPGLRGSVIFAPFWGQVTKPLFLSCMIVSSAVRDYFAR